MAALGGVRLEVVAGYEGDLCRVRFLARPRPTAAIQAELWLPAPRRWSGRYYQMGNGGFAGTIHAETLAAAAARGDAAAATDTGHKGDGFDARWAAHRPDLVADYAWRSIGVTSAAARRLVAAYYGQPARWRYFMGCSNGGRQALVAASRWPRDWDGVIAGAPASHWPATLAAFAAIQYAIRVVPGGSISADRLPALLAAAHRLCSATNGGCVARLAEGCRRGIVAACLTIPQRAVLQRIERAGYPPGRADQAEWQRWIFGPDLAPPSQAAFAIEAYRYIFADRPDWTLQDLLQDNGAPQARFAQLFEPKELTGFLDRGGKILSYFGWADAVLPPEAAVRDYAALQRARRTPLQAGYRIFMVPGMAHCQGGKGATSFGQASEAPASADDQEHDVRRALEAWVELGKPPDHLITTTVGTAASGQRILYPLAR